jgi:hypothetical protein
MTCFTQVLAGGEDSNTVVLTAPGADAEKSYPETQWAHSGGMEEDRVRFSPTCNDDNAQLGGSKTGSALNHTGDTKRWHIAVYGEEGGAGTPD